MLDTVKINHVQHISFTQSRLTDAASVILSELLSYEHPSKARGAFHKDLSCRIRRTAANRPAHPAAFAAYGGKQAPALRAAFSAPQAENRPSALQLTQRLTS